MGKIKLNLASGAVAEKPLINAFKANNNEYVVLDNEINGSMGLPIILVCKLSDGRLVKISDQAEWQLVKEYLKNIIAGNSLENIKIPNEISADDIYYTQLTLPVPSFDALKNAYKVEVSGEVGILDVNTATTPNVTPEPQVQSPAPEPPVQNPTPVQEPVVPNPTGPVIDIGISNPGVTPEPVPTPTNEPVVDIGMPTPPVTPTNEVTPSTPVTPTEPVVNQENSQVNPMPNNITVDTFKEQKDAFMQACENMFDALVQKFEKELENRK